MMDPKKVGYLRLLPAAGARPAESVGPTKAMANKFVASGHATCVDGRYARTPAGDAMVADFDANLSPNCVAILSDVAAGRGIRRDVPGIGKLVDSGLVRFSMNGTGDARISPAGEDLLAGLEAGPSSPSIP